MVYLYSCYIVCHCRNIHFRKAAKGIFVSCSGLFFPQPVYCFKLVVLVVRWKFQSAFTYTIVCCDAFAIRNIGVVCNKCYTKMDEECRIHFNVSFHNLESVPDMAVSSWNHSSIKDDKRSLLCFFWKNENSHWHGKSLIIRSIICTADQYWWNWLFQNERILRKFWKQSAWR